ncbi:hypothetical protein HELRODRAFT_173809 [Helobdella robusta]|uniref:Uncharacterized protein n=1 Tax=Helobdella robusta TaxID=6412 RepID=T1F792_HELRO|nr:hypothetical protein HELRODRAFT_173809 [Helobdella robusta]ESO02975.1 hypothetical protein HELRODRAFT_173809 [Helobdella robusta]
MDNHVDVLIPFQITLYNNSQKFYRMNPWKRYALNNQIQAECLVAEWLACLSTTSTTRVQILQFLQVHPGSRFPVNPAVHPFGRSELKKLVADAKSKKSSMQRQFFIQSQRSCGKMADCEVQKLTDEGVVDGRASRRMIHATAQKLTMKNYNDLKIDLGLLNIRSIMSKYEMVCDIIRGELDIN